MKSAVEQQLKQLRLSGMLATLEVRNQEAISGDLSHMDFLTLLLQDELDVRRDRKSQRLLKQAGFRELKTLEQFDFGFNQSINRKEVFDLATGRYLTLKSNILLLGPSGVGKSHLAQALGLCAINQGHAVRYRSAFDLAVDLAEAEVTGHRKAAVHALVKPGLLIIDDFGLRTLPKTAAEDFLEVLMRRYEVNSTIFTSNRPLEDFGKVLGDNTAAMAILDRFLHHAHLLKIKGRSYRLQHRSKNT